MDFRDPIGDHTESFHDMSEAKEDCDLEVDREAAGPLGPFAVLALIWFFDGFERAGRITRHSLHDGSANAPLEAANAAVPCVVTTCSAPEGTSAIVHIICDEDDGALVDTLREIRQRPALQTSPGEPAQPRADWLSSVNFIAAWNA